MIVTLRVLSVLALCLAWLWLFFRWLTYPQSAGAAVLALLGFVGLGVAAWLAPIESRSERTTVRLVGTIIAIPALLADTVLVLALREGL